MADAPAQHPRRSRDRSREHGDIPRLRTRLLDPVVAVLALAGFFDGLAGNPVHALLLIGAALLLVVRPPAEPAQRPGAAVIGRLRWFPVALPLAAAYATVVGGLQRYTWPVTFAVIVPGVVALFVAQGTPEAESPEPEIDRAGAAAWLVVLGGIAIWELVNFLLQPSLLEGSRDHPTLSTLFNEVVVGHPTRALALFLWLSLGWWLVTGSQRAGR
jgi:hypothetical protein